MATASLVLTAHSRAPSFFSHRLLHTDADATSSPSPSCWLPCIATGALYSNVYSNVYTSLPLHAQPATWTLYARRRELDVRSQQRILLKIDQDP